ncbi:MAG: hypothetical protein AAF224_05095 [Pseudomonadota bacterium]
MVTEMDLKPITSGALPTATSSTPESAAAPRDAEAIARDNAIRQKAAEFESVFIGQFLKSAGLEKAFGQEAGHFGQFLLNDFSEKLAQNGGFGIAEQVYQQLKEQDAAAAAIKDAAAAAVEELRREDASQSGDEE